MASVVCVDGRGVPNAVVRGHRVQRHGADGHRHRGQVAVAVRGARVRAVPAVRHGRRGRPLRHHQRAVDWQRWRRGNHVPRRGHGNSRPVRRRAGHVHRARVSQHVRPGRLRRAAPAGRCHPVGRPFHVHVRHTHAHTAVHHAIFPFQVRTPPPHVYIIGCLCMIKRIKTHFL